MALALVLSGLGSTLVGTGTVAAEAPVVSNTVTLQTQSLGNHAWSVLDESGTGAFGRSQSRHIPTRPRTVDTVACGTWSDWHFRSVNSVTGNRKYGVFIYDGCNTETQVFPPGPNQCNNDDSGHASARYSMCLTLPPRTLVAGLTPQTCNAQAVVATSLNADVTPAAYDPAQSTPLTVTTSFGPQFAERLSEGFCTDIVDWQVTGWTIRWPDGTQDAAPGSGQQGITATHTAAATSPGAPTKVVAIAHLHIHGQAMDFDPSTQLVTVTRDAFVDVSNDAAALATATPPVYTPPQLQGGAVPISQLGDGSMPGLDPAIQPAVHAAAIRGRLLDLYPRAVVVTPGTESVGGAVVGQSVTTTTSWRYPGAPNDAPLREATPAGSTGGPAQPITVQYNHAEALSASGAAVDEAVPVQVTAHTVYPDGHAEDTTLDGAVTVSIYYPALAMSA